MRTTKINLLWSTDRHKKNLPWSQKSFRNNSIYFIKNYELISKRRCLLGQPSLIGWPNILFVAIERMWTLSWISCQSRSRKLIIIIVFVGNSSPSCIFKNGSLISLMILINRVISKNFQAYCCLCSNLTVRQLPFNILISEKLLNIHIKSWEWSLICVTVHFGSFWD